MKRRLLTISGLLGLAGLACVPAYLLAHNEPELLAKASYVQDLTDGRILFAKNPEAQLPLASLTKLMTVYAANREEVVTEEESCFTLVTSSNEHAESIGAKLSDKPNSVMNIYAKHLGLAQTFYLNSSGLDVSERLSGAYGSARDQVMLLTAFHHDYSELLRCTTKPKAALEGPTLSNTNINIGKTIGIIGSKTGFTDLAGGNLAVIVDVGINHPVAIVVLGSTAEGRFSDVETLVDYAIDALSHEQ